MGRYDHILAKGRNKEISLKTHLIESSVVAMRAAENWGLDITIAREGALIHDIGKANPIFQRILKGEYSNRPFRHEIASIFFISLFKKEHYPAIIEMIIGHHKSIYNDARKLGILDLYDSYDDLFEYHAGDFQSWSKDALSILREIGIETHDITIAEAKDNYLKTLEYCEKTKYGWSRWRGLLISADHFSSAIAGKVTENIKGIFKTPQLGYYSTLISKEYPLSLIRTDSSKPHTILQAPTGSGKTNFLLRRCRGRIFYILPYQASINAMYSRIKNDIGDVTEDIRLLHSTSKIYVKDGKIEERLLQDKIGSAIKVLTPHQIASIVFGIKGYESVIMDIKGNDVILDEIHTYSNLIQSIVIKMIEILDSLGCRIHIGTATMPSALYDKIINILGKENTYQVSLPDSILDGYDRHRIYKLGDLEESINIINEAVNDNQKVLIVCNQVARSQNIYNLVKEKFPQYPSMLIHSRYKRYDRQNLEQTLIHSFNNSENGCIVVSTQVVEVSLDISFDIMITECAPIDAMIQRFGRINRKRKWGNTEVKPICIIKPYGNKKDSLPYTEDVLERSYKILPNNELLHERDIQNYLDEVYPEVEVLDIDLGTVYENGKWKMKKLWHKPKSALLETMDIDSATCIIESDVSLYINAGTREERLKCEIPINFNSISWKNLKMLNKGTHPFVIPDKAYDRKIGLILHEARPENYSVNINIRG